MRDTQAESEGSVLLTSDEVVVSYPGAVRKLHKIVPRIPECQ